MRKFSLPTVAIALVSAIGTMILVAPATAATASVSITGPAKISALKASNWTVQVKPARKTAITITLDGQKVLSGKTDSAGKYPITWNPSVVGNFKLVASVAKSGKYKAAKSATFKISISKLATKVDAAGDGWTESLDWNDDVTVTAQVSPNLGKLNKGRQVQLEFFSTEDDEWQVDDTGKTDSNGQVDLAFVTNSEMDDGSDTCDDSNIDDYDGAEYRYRFRALGTKLTKEAVTKAQTVTFYCGDGSGNDSDGDSITASSSSDYIDLATDSLEITVEVTTESGDYTVTEEYCDVDNSDCSDDTNWESSSSQSYSDTESAMFTFYPSTYPGTYQFRYILETFDTEQTLMSNTVEVTIEDSSENW